MSRLIKMIIQVINFINHKLWKVRLNKVDAKQSGLIKQTRIFALAIKGFNDDKCIIKASALTYYTLFSIVPVVALIFAIAKGFNFEKSLQEQLLRENAQHADILNQVFMYANTMLESTKGGLIAGVGVVLLLWSVMKLLGNIESSFNEIWEIKKDRTIVRKVTDYLSIMLIAPILIVVSGSISVMVKTQLENLMNYAEWLKSIEPILGLVLHLFSLLIICGLFTFIYLVLPNTKVNFKSAFIAGIICALLFELVQWAYVAFQIGAVQYNAIYGSFAALPLFLLWMQTSWYIVLFGAELSFANQNVDHYELEHEIQNISVRYKHSLAVFMANLVVKNFIAGKQAMTAAEIAEKLDMPIRLARSIIFDFTESKIFCEVKLGDEKEFGYQPAISDNVLTVRYIVDVLERHGVNEIPIHSTSELEKINALMDTFDDLLKKNETNILVRDIV